MTTSVCRDGARCENNNSAYTTETFDPEQVLQAAMGTETNRVAQRQLATAASEASVLQKVQNAVVEQLVYRTPEDDLMHGHISDAQLAFYTRNALVAVAVLVALLLFWKLCVSHRCWQRRHQRYADAVSLDYRAQVKTIRERKAE